MRTRSIEPWATLAPLLAAMALAVWASGCGPAVDDDAPGEPDVARCGALAAPCCLGPGMPTPGVCVGELRCVVLDRSAYGMPGGTCVK